MTAMMKTLSVTPIWSGQDFKEAARYIIDYSLGKNLVN